MNLKKRINKVIRRLRYGYRASSEDYIKYLKSKGCSIGKGTHFFDPINCKIDPVRLEYIKIGEYTKITSNFTMLAHDYSYSCLIHTHGEILPPGGEYTTIGNNCFIGMNVKVLKGVTIGDNSIVGVNSVVTKDLPGNGVYAGAPAKLVMTLDEYYRRRRESFIEDARRCAEHLEKKYGRKPNIKEMGMYSILFLEKNEENWNRYFKNIPFQGCDEDEVKNSFMNTEPVFADIEDFLNNK